MKLDGVKIIEKRLICEKGKQWKSSQFKLVEQKETDKPLPEGVLGRAYGICTIADIKNENDRFYSEDLFDKAHFDSPFTEQMKSRGLYGEADHPDEIDVSIHRASHLITNIEKKDKEYHIYEDILDTPAGNLVYTILKAGGNIGWSSRGVGSSYFEEGTEIVDPDDFELITYDHVIGPSVVKSISYLENKKKKEVEKFLYEHKEDKIIGKQCEHILNSLKKESHYKPSTSTKDQHFTESKDEVTMKIKKVKESLENVIADYIDKNKLLENETDSLVRSKDFHKSIAKKILNQQLDLQDKFDKIMQEKELYEEAIERLDNTLTILEKKSRLQRLKLKKLKRDNNALRLQNEDLKKDYESKREKYESLRKNSKQILQQVDGLKAQNKNNQRFQEINKNLKLELYKFKVIVLNKIIDDKFIYRIKEAKDKEQVKNILKSYFDDLQTNFDDDIELPDNLKLEAGSSNSPISKEDEEIKSNMEAIMNKM